MIDTSRSVFPNLRLGTTSVAIDAPFVFALSDSNPEAANPSAAVPRMKQRRVFSFERGIAMLLCRRKWLARVFGCAHHLFHFLLLHIERETVGQARLRIVVLQTDFVGFVT